MLELQRTGVAAVGIVILLLALLLAGPGSLTRFLVLLALILASEALAIPRHTGGGVVSVTFLVLATSVFLLGLGTALALGGLSVIVGDGLLRRRPWTYVLEKTAILTTMLAGAAGVVAVNGPEVGTLFHLLPHLVMGFWVVLFLANLALHLRGGWHWDPNIRDGLIQPLVVVAVWTHPLWWEYIPANQVAFVFSRAPDVMLLAAAAMVIDTVTTALVHTRRQGLLGLRTMGDSLAPAFYLYSAQALGAALLIWAHQQGQAPGLAIGSAFIVLVHYAVRLRFQKQGMLAASLCAIAAALDAKDPYTRGHSDRVARYALAVARALGFSGKRQNTVQLAARLHDIGKIGIPDAVLLKPGRFNPDEYEVMKTHVQKGVGILRNLPELREIAGIVEQEHERWDGAGYPRSLKGQDIALEARIIAAADVYDALTSDRPYREAIKVEEALEAVGALAGKELDPYVVSRFQEVVKRGALDYETPFSYCLTH